MGSLKTLLYMSWFLFVLTPLILLEVGFLYIHEIIKTVRESLDFKEDVEENV